MWRLISRPTLEALRPGMATIMRIWVPLPTSIHMTCPFSSLICGYNRPMGAAPFHDGNPDNLQPKVVRLQLDNGRGQ